MSNAPRVTPEEVQAAIKEETYTVLPNGRTTVCQLTLDNGFTVEGLSACVNIENFDLEIGKQISRRRAEDKVWKLLGFRLAERSFQSSVAPEEAAIIFAPDGSHQLWTPNSEDGEDVPAHVQLAAAVATVVLSDKAAVDELMEVFYKKVDEGNKDEETRH